MVLAAEGAPVLLLGIPAGTNRSVGRQEDASTQQLLAAPLAALVPVLHYAALLSFPLLLLLVFLGTLWTSFYAAQVTIIPDLLGEDEHVVARGNAILQGANRSTYWLGPLAAGFFIAASEAPVVLFIDAATFLVGAALLTGVSAARAAVKTEHATTSLRVSASSHARLCFGPSHRPRD